MTGGESDRWFDSDVWSLCVGERLQLQHLAWGWAWSFPSSRIISSVQCWYVMRPLLRGTHLQDAWYFLEMQARPGPPTERGSKHGFEEDGKLGVSHQ